MARSVRDTKLESRAARQKLAVRKEPYWKCIGQGLHIGYYRGSKSGAWYARFRGDQKKYVWEVLAQSDDVMDSDGIKTLSFFEAQEKARAWHTEQLRAETGNRTHIRNYTVENAVKDYLAWLAAEGKKSLSYSQNTADVHIFPHFGNVELKKLTTKQIQDWRNKIASEKARVRSKTDAEQAYKEGDDTAEELRKRKSTTNRILTVLKAALNYAFREGYVANDEAWRRVKPFHNVDNPSRVFLTKAECIRFMNACDPHFRKLVQAALFTGCRYGELGNLRCSDFDAASGTCLIRDSKSGKPRRVTLSAEGQKFFKEQAMGRSADAPLLTRANGGKWGDSHQKRPFREALKAARIEKDISFHGLRDTHASYLAEQGVPMAVIAAQLGHSDTRISEKHYAHLSPSYVTDTIRANLPVFGITEDHALAVFDNTKIRRAKKD